MWFLWVGLVACGGNGGGGPPAVVLRSIAITPAMPSVAAGTSVQLTATGMYSDATTMDLSAMVTWSSSAIATATVSATGLFEGLKAGGATITATFGGVSGTANATVTAAVLTAIQVTPVGPDLALGTKRQLTAMGVFSDATTQDLTTQVTWTSDSDHVTVTTGGLVTAVTIGSATIKAAKDAISGTMKVTTTNAALSSIAITPPAPSVARGRTLQLTAIATFSDATTQDFTAAVQWASATTANATIGTLGLVQAVNAGTSMITATFGSVTGSTLLTVTAAALDSIAVTPTNPSVAKGRTRQFTATGTFSDATTQDLTTQVTWTSSDATIAKVSNAAGSQGLAATLGVGSTTVSATIGPVSGSSVLKVTAAVLDTIAVTPTNPSVAKGRSQQFTATGTFSDLTTQDLTTQVTWASDTAATATVSNAAGSQGLATALQVGTATISATIGTVSGATLMTVTAAVVASIAVTPTAPSLPAGRTLPFTATGTFSDLTTQDLTTQVTWASSSTAAATISNAAGSQGLATAAQVGATTISATLGTVSGSTTLTVTAALLDSIQVTPVNPLVSAGTTISFTATGTFSDASTQNLTTQVTWASSDVTVATISNAIPQGVATTIAPGTTTITATLGSVSGSTALTVTDATLVSIQVTPVDPSLAAGLTLGFTATGTFSDATTQDMTTQVTWASGDDAIATISNAAGSSGVAHALVVGATTISATFVTGGTPITGSTTLTVTPALLVSIQVTPVNPALALGRTLGFIATGTFTDLTTQDLTAKVTWVSSVETVATISNAANSQGLATSVAIGSTTISATLGSVTGATVLTVTSAVLDSIVVTPADASLAKGRTLPFTATGIFSDLTTQDLTTQVAWASSAITIAQISNAAGSAGLATAINVGTTTITATLGTVVGSTGLVVTTAVLDSIAVTPTNPSVAKGRTQQFTATGTFSDATTQDLTTQVTWAPADPAIAEISNAAGSAGLATTQAVGATAISATLGTVTGSTVLTVTAAVLESIAVTPVPATVTPTGTLQLTATGTFSDATTQSLTATATWASADPTIATVTNTGTRGKVTGIAVGTTTITATSGTIVGSTSLVVLPPDVSVALPRDTTIGNRLSTVLVVVFNQPMAPGSITTQTAAGACSGSVQLSSDGFATCLGFTTAAPALTVTNTVATATPAAALQPLTTYKIRVRATVTNPAGVPMVADVTQPTGFTTGSGATCASGLVISQVYGGGGNSGAQFNNDFIELHNAGATPVDLTGLAVQFTSQSASTWAVQALPSVVLAAGGYFLIQESAGTTIQPMPLPTPDFTPAAPFAMGANNGKVALTAGITPLTGTCPVTQAMDFVGYGIAANLAGGCFEGTAGTAATANTTAALRGGAGCTDTNANSLDFAVSAPTPRSSKTTASVCACP